MIQPNACGICGQERKVLIGFKVPNSPRQPSLCVPCIIEGAADSNPTVHVPCRQILRDAPELLGGRCPFCTASVTRRFAFHRPGCILLLDAPSGTE